MVDSTLISAGYDAQRSEYLMSRGYKVLRFWNHEVMKDIDEVLVAIELAMREEEG